jgi:23S rRNA (uracil1939-C5)-methyltransferase
VGRLENGAIIFVPFTAPGDEVEVNILKTSKSYSEGEITTLLKPSELRVSPQCSVFGKCGGCTWQHLPYELQFETKKKGLLHALKRGGVDPDSIPVDELPASTHYHYRNRIQLRGNPKDRTIGFYSRGNNTIVPISDCPITRQEINHALPALAEAGFKNFQEDFKLEIEVTPEGKIRHAFNERHAAFGFRQVNDEQNEKLQNWVSTHTTDAELLLDLYGGYGNLSQPMASRFGEIRCVDVSVPDSRSKLPNFFYEKKDMKKWAQSQEAIPMFAKRTSVILDPPREGMGPQFSETLAKISKYKVQSLILVGCDVDSFVKDSARITKHGYRLARLGVLDLFPQTPHVESLALFFK